MKSSLSRNQGFSLIELMIVIAIIGILAFMAAPKYQQYIQRQTRADCMGQLQHFALLLERYYINNNSYTGAAAALGLPMTNNRQTCTFSITNPVADQWQSYLLTAENAGSDNLGSVDGSCSPMTLDSQNQTAPAACWQR